MRTRKEDINYHKSMTELIPFVIEGLEAQKTMLIVTYRHYRIDPNKDSKVSDPALETVGAVDKKIKEFEDEMERSKSFLNANGIDIDRSISDDIEIRVRDDFFERIRLAWNILTARKSKKATQ